MDKYAIAQVLREIGQVIELTDENPSKCIAYYRASRAIEAEPDFDKYLGERSLEAIPGVGKKIAWMIMALSKEGHLAYHEELLKRIPETLFELLWIPGLGPKRLRTLYENFHIETVEELRGVLEDGRARQLKGFGPAYIKKLLTQISKVSEQGVSLLYPQALSIACTLVDILKVAMQKLEITGELRRKAELIRQIDLVGVSKAPEKAFSLLVNHSLVKKVLRQEENGLSVVLKQGIMVRVNVCTSKEFPFFLLETTGNQAHLEELQKEASRMVRSQESLKIAQEEEIYHQLGLPFIPPELREGYGEVKAMKSRNLQLVEESDLQGALHCHTTDSDGIHTIVEMAAAARKLGWSYIGISDHSRSSYFANGMSQEKLLQQREEIRRLNESVEGFYIFSGIECDILKDGELDYSEEVLKKLDFVIVSAHSHFKLEKSEMTKRFIRAVENPHTTMIGHLTGRILRHRDPYQLDIQKVIDACIANNKVIELNACPNRLDMDWRMWIQAKEKGLKCCINPDAHSIEELKNCQYGVNMARKGWLEKDDVINTYSLSKMKRYLKRQPI